MESFFNNVLIQIYSQTSENLYLKEEESSYRHHLKSNRVDFTMRWSMYGLVPGMNSAIKLEYTATTAANWLAYLSNLFVTAPPEDLGPYGSAQVCGLGEAKAPIIDIHWGDKRGTGFVGGTTAPDTGGGPSEGVMGAVTPASKHIYFSQQYHFITKANKYVPNGASTPIEISIRPSEVYLMVTGEAERPDPDLSVPPPPISIDNPAFGNSATPCATLLECDVTTKSPTVDGNYRLTWRYLLRLHKISDDIINGALNYTIWPYSPMLPDAPPNSNWEIINGRAMIIVQFPNPFNSGLD